jgi:3-dehydroquinate synthase
MNRVRHNRRARVRGRHMPIDSDSSIYAQSFLIPASYPIYFTNDVFNLSNPCLLQAVTHAESNRRHRLFVILDKGVLKARPHLSRNLTAYVNYHEQHMDLTALPYVVPGGERSKNDLNLPARLQKRLYQLNMDRQSIVLIVGGGAVLDMVGYAAATTHRGIRVIRLPTTVLAQADGGLGVKNGINAFGVKNFLGTFAVPFAIVNDAQFIDTLPARHRTSGMAEAVKVALIRDAGFFDWLETNTAALTNFEPSALAHLIRHSAEIHLGHIASSGDPFESGSARPLDFGHWAAHKLETLSGYRLHHGEAVAIGIAIDSRYSTEIGLLSEQACGQILCLLDRLKLPSWHRTLDLKGPDGRLKILRGLDEFKEHIGGELTITLLKQIGQGTEADQIDHAVIHRALSWLRKRHSSRCVSR